MQQRMRSAIVAAVVTGVSAGLSGAEASVTVTAQETGGNVVFSTPGGTLDVSALTMVGGTGVPLVNPSVGGFTLGATGGAKDFYSPINGPSSFGSGTNTVANSGSGDRFGVTSGQYLEVPDGFVSGGSIAHSSATFTAQTFAGLGITPGSYTWSWGADETSDFVTLNVVPLPAAAILMLTGLAGLFGFRRVQRQAASASPGT